MPRVSAKPRACTATAPPLSPPRALHVRVGSFVTIVPLVAAEFGLDPCRVYQIHARTDFKQGGRAFMVTDVVDGATLQLNDSTWFKRDMFRATAKPRQVRTVAATATTVDARVRDAPKVKVVRADTFDVLDFVDGGGHGWKASILREARRQSRQQLRTTK